MELTPKVEEHTVKVEGRTVSYSARGPHDAEYIYLGINGLMGGGDSFWPVIEGVPDNWRVLMPDLPGCGGSEPMRKAENHTVDGYAEWLELFLQELGLYGKKLVLASIATGAPIATRYALEHGDQTQGLVLHLPFLGKPAIASKWARPIVAYGLRIRPLRRLVDRLRASDAVMHRIIIHEPPDAIPELAERDIHHKQEADLKAAGQLLRDLMLRDARTELPHIQEPVLILASEHDFSAPLPMLERIARRPNRYLYVYRGGQHSWNEEFIDEMNREISEFLRKIAPGND